MFALDADWSTWWAGCCLPSASVGFPALLDSISAGHQSRYQKERNRQQLNTTLCSDGLHSKWSTFCINSHKSNCHKTEWWHVYTWWHIPINWFSHQLIYTFVVRCSCVRCFRGIFIKVRTNVFALLFMQQKEVWYILWEMRNSVETLCVE